MASEMDRQEILHEIDVVVDREAKVRAAEDVSIRAEIKELREDSEPAIKLANGFDALSRSLTFICTLLVAAAGIWEFTR